jgi:hypothetical protein
MHHKHHRYIEIGASVAGNHSVRGLGPLTRGIATAQYLVGCIATVPDLSRWVPCGFPEVIREICRASLSRNRETRTDSFVSCPKCGAPRGVLRGLQRVQTRGLHQERSLPLRMELLATMFFHLNVCLTM